MNLISLAESGLVPDALVRSGIRRLLAQRCQSVDRLTPAERATKTHLFADQLRDAPLAVATDAANEQHYEVPAEFYRLVLGPRLKYSACLFDSPETPLSEAEEAMLRLTCQRAGLGEGMRVLELGCGWGSLTLWMAQHYPGCQVTALSNSHGQRRYIEARAKRDGLQNVTVLTADMREFSTDQRFDRVVSVEMFEHMRNYQLLLRRVAQWLEPDGLAFVHIFCHRDSPYLFDTTGGSDWMGRHFFTGGMMPSERLFDQFDDALRVDQQWRVDGMHYWHTCQAWLANLDGHRREITQLLERDLNRRNARVAVQRWRMFFMACAELFRYRVGEEWFVCHYRMRHAQSPARLAEIATPQPIEN